MEYGARSGWPVPKEPAAKQGQSWVEECSLGWGFHRHALAPWSSAESSSGKYWFFPDQRVTCDYINCRGTEHRQQLLLIFNTKSQGNSEKGYITTLYRGMVDLSTSTSQLFNAFFFHLCLSCQRCWKHFLLPEKWFGLQHDTCTEWHFIFWFLFSTDKPRPIGQHWQTKGDWWSQ